MINKYRDHLVGQLPRVLWTPFLYLRLQGVHAAVVQGKPNGAQNGHLSKINVKMRKSSQGRHSLRKRSVRPPWPGPRMEIWPTMWRELGWRYFEDNKTTQDRRHLPGRGECKGNMGLGNRQGSEEADEGLPVHPRARPSRLHSLHCCALPQLAVAIFRFTWCAALKNVFFINSLVAIGCNVAGWLISVAFSRWVKLPTHTWKCLSKQKKQDKFKLGSKRPRHLVVWFYNQTWVSSCRIRSRYVCWER